MQRTTSTDLIQVAETDFVVIENVADYFQFLFNLYFVMKDLADFFLAFRHDFFGLLVPLLNSFDPKHSYFVEFVLVHSN